MSDTTSAARAPFLALKSPNRSIGVRRRFRRALRNGVQAFLAFVLMGALAVWSAGAQGLDGRGHFVPCCGATECIHMGEVTR